MRLTIDAGNTRTKWALFDDAGVIVHLDACLNADIAQANLLPSSLSCDEIVISNVAGDAHAQQLQQLVIDYQAITYWFNASKLLGGVFNCYTTAEQLGSDRWAAMVGAWSLQQKTCLVVNAGTATTIDAVIETQIDGTAIGLFTGGLILPGIALMQKSLGSATAQLPTPAQDAINLPLASISPFATNTAQAIQSGALIATIGAIEHTAQAIQHKHGDTPVIIVSGGNAKLIAQYVKEAEIAENLVLLGLFRHA